MSMVAAALRIAAVNALRGATSAGAAVHDSIADPRDLIDDARFRYGMVVNSDKGRTPESFGAAQTIDLTIDLFCAAAKNVTIDGEQAIEIDFAVTDGNNAAALDELSFEALNVLYGNVSTPWADVFRAFVTGPPQIDWEAGADASRSRRFAFRSHVLHLTALADPRRGDPLPDGGPWSRLLVLMDGHTDPHVQNRAILWRSMLTTPDIAEWQRDLRELGLSLADARALAFVPFDEAAGAEADPRFSGDDLDRDVAIEVGADDAQRVDGDADPVGLIEVPPS